MGIAADLLMRRDGQALPLGDPAIAGGERVPIARPSGVNRTERAVPPDLMFPVESIDSSCARCHEGHDVESRAVVKRFLERSPTQTDPKSLVCTSCHGEHHLRGPDCSLGPENGQAGFNRQVVDPGMSMRYPT